MAIAIRPYNGWSVTHSALFVRIEVPRRSPEEARRAWSRGHGATRRGGKKNQRGRNGHERTLKRKK